MASPFDEEVDLFKDIVWDNAIDAALAALFARIPWLSWGPFKWLATYIIEKFTDTFYGVISSFLDVNAIGLLNEKDHSQYTVTSIKLREVADDYGIFSEEFKEAKKNARKDFRDLVQYRVVK